MSRAVEMAQIWRGDLLEGRHMGHAVVCNGAGEIVESWGDPELIMFPRSSCKMVQALPLVESGAELSSQQLALACASHTGAAVHTQAVAAWLADLGLAEEDLRCGAHDPGDDTARRGLVRAGESPCQLHNNCSGKHAGFLMMNQRLGGGTEYIEPDHPLQRAIRTTFEEVTGVESPGYGIDGCSAPNFATTLHGLARAMAFFATAHQRSGARDRAAARLAEAMGANPVLVGGEGKADTALMRAMGGAVVTKTGAEAVYVAILRDKGLGVALKIEDGTTRASESAIASILIRLGVLDAGDPAVRGIWNARQTNWRGFETGWIRPGAAFA